MTSATEGPSIVIAGAGAIGCHAGGCLALAGRRVTLLGRPGVVEAVGRRGLVVRDLDKSERRVAPNRLAATTDPAAALAAADVVLVTVKSGATAEMADLVARHGRSGARVVSLQNGVRNAETLRARLGDDFAVVAGMVPFNVVAHWHADAAPVLHRATEGTTLVDAAAGLAALLDAPGFPVAGHADMSAVLWGKLLMNLNNGLNALSGLPLARQLADRRWRRLLADQIAEALAAMRAAVIRPAGIGGVPAALLPAILRLPDFAFRVVAARMLAIDPAARSSMWVDLTRGRPTEIDEFQGAVVELAARNDLAAPVCEKVMAAVRRAETEARGSPALDPSGLV